MNAVAFYIALALILWSILGRRIGLLAVAVAAVLALGVGISRIYLGYHYLTDVVGGILAGIAWLLVVGTALRARPAWRRGAGRAARAATRSRVETGGRGMTRALVIGRRRPGRPIGKTVRETCQAAARPPAGPPMASWSTTKRQLRRGSARAVKDGVDVVVAVGGDGAVLQVLQSVAGTDGRSGDRADGDGQSPRGQPRHPQWVSTGWRCSWTASAAGSTSAGVKARGRRRYFAIACGVGFDADVMDATDREGRSGGSASSRTSRARSGGRARSATSPTRSRSTESARTMDAAQVLIANFGRLGAGLKARLEVEPDDGLLDVMVIRASGPLSGLLAGLGGAAPGRARGDARGPCLQDAGPQGPRPKVSVGGWSRPTAASRAGRPSRSG